MPSSLLVARDPAVRAATRRHLVLIVEDDDETRASLTEMLDQLGYCVAVARDGFEALRLLSAGLRPIVMLIDLDMPEMNGEAFCAACESDPNLATIWRFIVSGADMDAMRRCRAHAFVGKPLNEDTFLDLLERVTAISAGRRPNLTPANQPLEAP